MKEISVYVPASSEYFSFNLDENTPLAVLADEVSAMLRQYDRCDDIAVCKAAVSDRIDRTVISEDNCSESVTAVRKLQCSASGEKEV